MKINNLFLFPVLFLISCSFTAVEPLKPGIEPVQEVFMQHLRIGQVKSFQVNDLKSGLEATSYRWIHDKGSIISQTGRNISFQAPDTAGKITLICQQMHDEKLLGTTSFEIQVYRQVVILKADDLVYVEGSIFPHNWNKYFELVEGMGIKGTAGIIGNSMEKAPNIYFEKIKKHHQKGNIEFWNHGYTHKLGSMNSKGEIYHEFNNSGREFQRSHLERTQTLGKEKLGITFSAFGAPGNQIDKDTYALIEENPEIRMWFYGHPESRKNVLKRTKDCEIEFPVHHPSYQKFKDNYNADMNILVLQFHPTRWSQGQFEEFQNILDYLKKAQVCFMTPMEMAREFHPELLDNTDEMVNIL